MTSHTAAGTSAERAQWMMAGVDTVLTDDSITYGRAFSIVHPQNIRLDVSMPVDALLRIYRQEVGTETVVRWVSGTQYVDDHMMVGMISDDAGKLWQFRNDILKVISKVPQADIMPVTDWLEDHVNGIIKRPRSHRAA